MDEKNTNTPETNEEDNSKTVTFKVPDFKKFGKKVIDGAQKAQQQVVADYKKAESDLAAKQGTEAGTADSTTDSTAKSEEQTAAEKKQKVQREVAAGYKTFGDTFGKAASKLGKGISKKYHELGEKLDENAAGSTDNTDTTNGPKE